MFKKRNEDLEAIETRLIQLDNKLTGLERAWEKELLDLSDIKQQVLRTLNRLIAQERRAKPDKSSENGSQLEIEEPSAPNPLALGILQRRR